MRVVWCGPCGSTVGWEGISHVGQDPCLRETPQCLVPDSDHKPTAGFGAKTVPIRARGSRRKQRSLRDTQKRCYDLRLPLQVTRVFSAPQKKRTSLLRVFATSPVRASPRKHPSFHLIEPQPKPTPTKPTATQPTNRPAHKDHLVLPAK